MADRARRIAGVSIAEMVSSPAVAAMPVSLGSFVSAGQGNGSIPAKEAPQARSRGASAVNNDSRAPASTDDRRAASEAASAPLPSAIAAAKAASGPVLPVLAHVAGTEGPRAASAPEMPVGASALVQAAADDETLHAAAIGNSAHLRLQTASGQDLSVHLRVRDGVADIRVEGSAGAHGEPALELRASELRTALAGEGIALGTFESPTSPLMSSVRSAEMVTARPKFRGATSASVGSLDPATVSAAAGATSAELASSLPTPSPRGPEIRSEGPTSGLGSSAGTSQNNAGNNSNNNSNSNTNNNGSLATGTDTGAGSHSQSSSPYSDPRGDRDGGRSPRSPAQSFSSSPPANPSRSSSGEPETRAGRGVHVTA